MSTRRVKRSIYYFNVGGKRYKYSEQIDEIVPETIDLTSETESECIKLTNDKPTSSIVSRRPAARKLTVNTAAAQRANRKVTNMVSPRMSPVQTTSPSSISPYLQVLRCMAEKNAAPAT